MTSKKLSRIIEWKGVVKEQMSMEMRKTRERLQVELNKLDGMKVKLAENMETMDSIYSRGDVDTERLELLSNYVIYLDKRIKEQETRISEILNEVEIKQSSLRNAYREERVFEILRNRIADEELRERQSIEQKELDFNTVTRKTNK
ncbi:MAG: flagellar FliJ family protein [Nitrospiraceae bacterium]|nr:flagellar FliJ family protein [Nitrospiraceae bacterium]MDA8325496.1 flagellar FliJ family protein [Nitrospiraceae bacterium]